MTLDEKLEQFYNVTIESATATNLNITTEYRESLVKVKEDHKKNSLEKSKLSFKLEAENLKREKNRSLTGASINVRRKISEKTACHTENLFQEVKEKLMTYMTTPEYLAFLSKHILDAKSFAREDEMKLYINASDSNIKEELEAATGVPLTLSSIDFIGGTRAVIPHKNILIDHSFSSKLQELKDNFTL